MAHPSPSPVKKSSPAPRRKRTPKPATPRQVMAEGESPTVEAPLPGFSRPLETDLPPNPSLNDPGTAGVAAAPESLEFGSIPEPPTSRRFKFGPFRRPRLRLLSGSVDEDTKEMLASAAGMALMALASLLHNGFAPDRRFGPNDVFKADADDHAHIADPLASIAARRVPAGMSEDSDVADLLHAAIGTGAYGVKNARARQQLVRLQQQGGWSPDLEGAADPVGSTVAADLATGAEGAA